LLVFALNCSSRMRSCGFSEAVFGILVDDLEVARDEVRFEPFATLREHGVRISKTGVP
jgi:hypothetical protein